MAMRSALKPDPNLDPAKPDALKRNYQSTKLFSLRNWRGVFPVADLK